MKRLQKSLSIPIGILLKSDSNFKEISSELDRNMMEILKESCRNPKKNPENKKKTKKKLFFFNDYFLEYFLLPRVCLVQGVLGDVIMTEACLEEVCVHSYGSHVGFLWLLGFCWVFYWIVIRFLL